MIHYPRFAARFAVLVSELRGKQVTVIGHQRPDADCIGSQVAICRVLRANGVDAVCVNPDKVPRRIKFLVGDTPFFMRDEVAPQGRLAVFTDCADHGRAGDKVREMYPAPIACFDHHISNQGFARFDFVDTASSATAEVLTGLFLDADLEIDRVTAQALYTGIMTDTGQFRFASTSERVFRLCAELVARGAASCRTGFSTASARPSRIPRGWWTTPAVSRAWRSACSSRNAPARSRPASAACRAFIAWTPSQPSSAEAATRRHRVRCSRGRSTRCAIWWSRRRAQCWRRRRRRQLVDGSRLTAGLGKPLRPEAGR